MLLLLALSPSRLEHWARRVWNNDVPSKEQTSALLELLIALLLSILKWSMGNGLLRSEVAQAVSSWRSRQKPSLCLSGQGIVQLWQDLWAALTFVVVAHESLKWMVWTLGPLEIVLCHLGVFDRPLAVEGIVPQKIWNTNPFLFPRPKGKKDTWKNFMGSAYTEKRDSSLMDRVSWCKSYITRSGNMITQRMIEGIIPEVLSLVVQLT